MTVWDKVVDLLPFVCVGLVASALWLLDKPLRTWSPWLCLVAFVLAVVGIVSLLIRWF